MNIIRIYNDQFVIIYLLDVELVVTEVVVAVAVVVVVTEKQTK